MANYSDIMEALSKVMSRYGPIVTPAEVHHILERQFRATVPAGPMGPAGMRGDQGIPGPAGKDAWDKFVWDPSKEAWHKCSWKGISFEFPLDLRFCQEFPEGELTYGDINYIRTVFGEAVLEKMSIFWRRQYDYVEDMSLFINQEDSCNLMLTDKSNSSPDPFKGC